MTTLILLFQCLGASFHNIADFTVDHIEKLSLKVFGINNPLLQWAHLLRLFTKRPDVLYRAFQVSLDSSSAAVGDQDEISIGLRYGAVAVGSGFQGLTFDQAQEKFLRLLDDYHHSYQPTTRLGVKIRRAYTRFLSIHERYTEAAELLSDIATLLKQHYDSEEDAVAPCGATDDLATYLLLQSRENYASAQAIRQKGVQRASAVAGESGVTTVYLCRSLARFYLLDGRTAEAEEQYDHLKAALEEE